MFRGAPVKGTNQSRGSPHFSASSKGSPCRPFEQPRRRSSGGGGHSGRAPSNLHRPEALRRPRLLVQPVGGGWSWYRQQSSISTRRKQPTEADRCCQAVVDIRRWPNDSSTPAAKVLEMASNSTPALVAPRQRRCCRALPWAAMRFLGAVAGSCRLASAFEALKERPIANPLSMMC